MTVKILHGDCIEVMKTLPADSVDALVADPPYGIRFMGKSWDGADIEKVAAAAKGRPDRICSDGVVRKGRSRPAEAAGLYDTSITGNRAFQEWTRLWGEQALRVLKPGGHLISFAAPRTYHRMACGIEDAGFELRDQIMWIFGSGFPKSYNLDGAHEGWGTALKPAHEPILLARKPLAGTVAGNMDAHGVGGLHIDACRVPTDLNMFFGDNGGRWPANVIHDGSDEVLSAFPDAPGQQGALTGNEPSPAFGGVVYRSMARTMPSTPRGDSGSAARFFYCAKTSKLDRDEGIADPEQDFVQFQTANGTSGKASSLSAGRATKYRNTHPTVKPTDLMRYLCRLVTPRGGTVLDPFMGSGSTGKAAVLEGFNFIGIDLDESYIKIAQQRIDFAAGALFGVSP